MLLSIFAFWTTVFSARRLLRSFRATTRHRQVTDLDVTVLGFSGPGLPSARQVLCGDAPRLFSIILVCMGRTELCHEVWTPGPQKPQIICNENHHLALLDARGNHGVNSGFGIFQEAQQIAPPKAETEWVYKSHARSVHKSSRAPMIQCEFLVKTLSEKD